MDYFEGTEIDSHELLRKMEAAIHDYEDAFFQLPRPLQTWFSDQYDLGGLSAGLMMVHLSTATESMAELIGADEAA